MSYVNKDLMILQLNPSGYDPVRRKKINLNFHFSHFFVVPQKDLWKP